MGWGGRLFEAGRLLIFSAFSMGAYSRWALIRGWALIRINTVYGKYDCIVVGRLKLESFFYGQQLLPPSHHIESCKADSSS